MTGGETQYLPSNEVVGFLERQIAGKLESCTTQPSHESELNIYIYIYVYIFFFGGAFVESNEQMYIYIYI